MKLTTEEVIERDELASQLAERYMAGFKPSGADVERAIALGLDPIRIQEAVDACYEPEDAED